MSDNQIRAHRDAVIASLKADLPGAVFPSYSVKGADGKPIVYPPRYTVVFTALSQKPRTRFTGGQWRERYTVTVHSVGVEEDSCLRVAERVGKLTGKTLTVANRTLWPVEFVTSVPPDLNDAGPKPLWFTVTQFDIISDPA